MAKWSHIAYTSRRILSLLNELDLHDRKKLMHVSLKGVMVNIVCQGVHKFGTHILVALHSAAMHSGITFLYIYLLAQIDEAQTEL